MDKGISNYRTFCGPRPYILGRQLGHPALLTGIQLGFCRNVSQCIVICPFSEYMALQPVVELVADGPFQG